MMLASKNNEYGNKEYHLVMDESEYKQAISGEPIYRMSASNKLVGEWTVTFKKFSKAKIKRMGY